MLKAGPKTVLERGIPKLTSLVRSGNRKVIGFYKRRGFEADEVAVAGKRYFRSHWIQGSRRA